MLDREISGALVERDRCLAEGLGGFLTDELHGLGVVDRLVMIADGGLGRRGEEDLVELGGVLIALTELLAVDGLGLLIFLPPRAGEIAAGDALDLDHVDLLDEHGASAKIFLVGLEFGRILIDVGGDEVVLHAEELHPEERELVEDLTLVGHAAGQDHVEGADAVGDDHQELVAEIEDIADLAAFLRDSRNGAFQECMVLVVFHSIPFN